MRTRKLKRFKIIVFQHLFVFQCPISKRKYPNQIQHHASKILRVFLFCIFLEKAEFSNFGVRQNMGQSNT